jgi:hypothetical protein
MTFQNSVLQGAAQQAVDAFRKAVERLVDLGPSPEELEEIDALGHRALDFLESGDYHKALAQAYLGLHTVERARGMAAIRRAARGSEPGPLG